MAAHQAPPSLGFSRQEHRSGLPFPSPMCESEKWKWSRSVRLRTFEEFPFSLSKAQYIYTHVQSPTRFSSCVTPVSLYIASVDSSHRVYFQLFIFVKFFFLNSSFSWIFAFLIPSRDSKCDILRDATSNVQLKASVLLFSLIYFFPSWYFSHLESM